MAPAASAEPLRLGALHALLAGCEREARGGEAWRSDAMFRHNVSTLSEQLDSLSLSGALDDAESAELSRRIGALLGGLGDASSARGVGGPAAAPPSASPYVAVERALRGLGVWNGAEGPASMDVDGGDGSGAQEGGRGRSRAGVDGAEAAAAPRGRGALRGATSRFWKKAEGAEGGLGAGAAPGSTPPAAGASSASPPAAASSPAPSRSSSSSSELPETLLEEVADLAGTLKARVQEIDAAVSKRGTLIDSAEVALDASAEGVKRAAAKTAAINAKSRRRLWGTLALFLGVSLAVMGMLVFVRITSIAGYRHGPKVVYVHGGDATPGGRPGARAAAQEQDGRARWEREARLEREDWEDRASAFAARERAVERERAARAVAAGAAAEMERRRRAQLAMERGRNPLREAQTAGAAREEGQEASGGPTNETGRRAAGGARERSAPVATETRSEPETRNVAPAVLRRPQPAPPPSTPASSRVPASSVPTPASSHVPASSVPTPAGRDEL